MIKLGIIKPSKSNYINSILIVPKDKKPFMSSLYLTSNEGQIGLSEKSKQYNASRIFNRVMEFIIIIYLFITNCSGVIRRHRDSSAASHTHRPLPLLEVFPFARIPLTRLRRASAVDSREFARRRSPSLRTVIAAAYDRACAVLPAPPMRKRHYELQSHDQRRGRAAERRRASPTIPTRLAGRRPDFTCPAARVLATSRDFISSLESPCAFVSRVPSRRVEGKRERVRVPAAPGVVDGLRVVSRGAETWGELARGESENEIKSALQLNWPLRL